MCVWCVWYNDVGPSAHVSSIVHIKDDKAEENNCDDGDDAHCVALLLCLVCLYYTKSLIQCQAYTLPPRVLLGIPDTDHGEGDKDGG